jgi:hypothetical protein
MLTVTGGPVLFCSARTVPTMRSGGAVGDDAGHVGATPDVLVEPLLRVVRPDLALLANSTQAAAAWSAAGKINCWREGCR